MVSQRRGQQALTLAVGGVGQQKPAVLRLLQLGRAEQRGASRRPRWHRGHAPEESMIWTTYSPGAGLPAAGAGAPGVRR